MRNAIKKVVLENPTGFSVDNSMQNIESGYAVSFDKKTEVSTKRVTLKVIDRYLKKRPEKDNVIYGGWYNEKDEKYYLDYSMRVVNKQEALKIARENKQLAIFDLNKKRAIYV